jgi:HPt (histidine-containing phosphotransfer) domain-containing protein
MPATMPDIATFIYEAASHLARSREALRRQDVPALRQAVIALRDTSQAAGAKRMVELCAGLRAELVQDGTEFERLLDEIAEEFDAVTSELQTVRSA